MMASPPSNKDASSSKTTTPSTCPNVPAAASLRSSTSNRSNWDENLQVDPAMYHHGGPSTGEQFLAVCSCRSDSYYSTSWSPFIHPTVFTPSNSKWSVSTDEVSGTQRISLRLLHRELLPSTRNCRTCILQGNSFQLDSSLD